MTLTSALARSYNQATVRVGMEVGPDRLSELLKVLAGLKAAPNPSLILGAVLALAAVLLALVSVLAILATDWGGLAERINVATKDVARALFTDWVLPFEVVGVLLLAAVIGGVFLAKRERGSEA